MPDEMKKAEEVEREKCPYCYNGICGEMSHEMALDACEPSMEGQPIPCDSCDGDGYRESYASLKAKVLSLTSALEKGRETLAQTMLALDLPTGHGNTIEDLCHELRTEGEELRLRYTSALERVRYTSALERVREEAMRRIYKATPKLHFATSYPLGVPVCAECNREVSADGKTGHDENCLVGSLLKEDKHHA